MYRLSVRRKGVLIVALSAVFKMTLFVGLILLQMQNQKAEEASAHSKQVLSVARQLLWELVNAETGMRGYIISGNPVFLDPYNAAVADVLKTQHSLENLCRDNPVMYPLAHSIEPIATDFLAYHARNKRLIEAGDLQPVREATRQGEGKRRMDNLRAEIQQIITEQEKVDAQADVLYVRVRSRIYWLLYAGMLSGLMITGAIHWILGNITGRIETLTNNNRVAAEGQEFGPTVPGNDEIAELDTQFRKLWTDKDLQTRRTLEIYARELERSNKDLQDFASVASHDLQEPLRKITAFSSRLETHLDSRLDATGSDYLQRIRNAAERMSSLNESLLQLSRVRSKTARTEQVELQSVMSNVLSDLEERITASGAVVECGKLPVIWADPNQMRQLFQNLVANALKFKKKDESPLVKINSRLIGDGMWEIVIQDNGVGFEQRFAEQIFRPFQRLHGRAEFEGNGIGLTIVEKIIARHDGTIVAKGSPGQGATFVLNLPEKQKQKESLNEDTRGQSDAALVG